MAVHPVPTQTDSTVPKKITARCCHNGPGLHKHSMTFAFLDVTIRDYDHGLSPIEGQTTASWGTDAQSFKRDLSVGDVKTPNDERFIWSFPHKRNVVDVHVDALATVCFVLPLVDDNAKGKKGGVLDSHRQNIGQFHGSLNGPTVLWYTDGPAVQGFPPINLKKGIRAAKDGQFFQTQHFDKVVAPHGFGDHVDTPRRGKDGGGQ